MFGTRFPRAALWIPALALLVGASPTWLASQSTGGSQPVDARSITVNPGTTASNGDVAVKNTSAPTRDPFQGKATITPGGADNPDATATTVRTGREFSGTIGGIEKGDRVRLDDHNHVTVTGTGGTVIAGEDGSLKVVNEAAEGGSSISVWTPHGGWKDVPPGGSYP